MKKVSGFTVLMVLSLSVLVGFGQTGQPEGSRSRGSALSGGGTGQGSNNVTTQEAFLRALITARLPGGFVSVRGCDGEEPTPQSGSVASPLREALESVIQADPQYRWQMERGVINLIPVAGEPDLLNVRIRQYRAADTSDINSALQQLLALPEVREGGDRLGLRRSSLTLLVGPSSHNQSQSRIRLHLRDVNLREALNALAQAHGRAVWRYREWHCNRDNGYAVDFAVQ